MGLNGPRLLRLPTTTAALLFLLIACCAPPFIRSTNAQLRDITSGPAVFNAFTSAPTGPTAGPTQQCVITQADGVERTIYSSKPICGGVNLETGVYTGPCQDYSTASFKGYRNVMQWTCPAGTFYDTGACWKCTEPRKVRSEFPITGGTACQNNDQSLWTYTGAKRMFKLRECPAGSFFDLVDGGGCYQCPPSHPYRTAETVKSLKACTKSVWTVLSLLSSDFSVSIYVKASPTNCGQYVFDPIDGGTCWSCGDVAVRTVYPVTGTSACENRFFGSALRVSQLGCGLDEFWDIYNNGDTLKGAAGTCWSCPIGYERSLFHVASDQACLNKNIVWESKRQEFGLYDIPIVTAALRDLLNGKFDELAVKQIQKLRESSLFSRDQDIKNLINNLDYDQGGVRTNPHPFVVSILTQSLLSEIGTESCFSIWFRKYLKQSRIFVATEANRMLDSYNQAYIANQGSDPQRILAKAWTGFIGVVPDFLSIAKTIYQRLDDIIVFFHAGLFPAVGTLLTSTSFSLAFTAFYAGLTGAGLVSKTLKSLDMFGQEITMVRYFTSLATAVGEATIILAVVQVVIAAGVGLLQIILADQMVYSIRSALDRAKAAEITAAYATDYVRNTAQGLQEFSYEFANAINGFSIMPIDIKIRLSAAKARIMSMVFPSPSFISLRTLIVNRLQDSEVEDEEDTAKNDSSRVGSRPPLRRSYVSNRKYAF